MDFASELARKPHRLAAFGPEEAFTANVEQTAAYNRALSQTCETMSAPLPPAC